MLTRTQSRCADILPVCAGVDRLGCSTRGGRPAPEVEAPGTGPPMQLRGRAIATATSRDSEHTRWRSARHPARRAPSEKSDFEEQNRSPKKAYHEREPSPDGECWCS